MDQLELSKLLLDEYKYLNGLFWKVLFSSVFGVSILLLVPFLKIEAKSGELLKELAYIFPSTAVLFTIGASWVLHTLHGRFRIPGDLYRHLLRQGLKELGLEGRYRITDPLQIPAVAKVAYLTFLVTGLAASLAMIFLIRNS